MSDVRSGYWAGVWPGEDGGPQRRQAPADGTPGLGMRPGESLAVRSRGVGMSCTVVARDPGELYLLGHTGPPNDVQAWVERIDPISLEMVRRSPLLDAGPFWPGGMAAHANGSLYVTYGRWCHRLDAECAVAASRELPRERPYNSLLVLPDGHLVMKDFAGGTGVHALPEGTRGSELVVLEPERLEIVARCELPEGSIARLSADVGADGMPLAYVVGDRHVMRLAWDGSGLTLDEGWTTEYLRFEGQSFGWDAVIEDGYAWFLDNGEGTNAFGPSFRGKGTAASPLHLVRVPLGGGPAEHWEVCGKPGGIVANPPVVDAMRQIAVGYDSGNGIVTAWDYSSGTGERLWSREQNQAGHMVLFPDTGELVSYDFDHERGTEQVVVLDIESGEEKGRAAIGSPVASVVFPCVGWARDVYVTTFMTVARVWVE